MQNIIVEEPYRFVPPQHGSFWPAVIGLFLPYYLRSQFGVKSIEYAGVENIRQSLQSGAGVLLAPNHCRPSDPFIVGCMAKHMGQAPYIMASWHLFRQGAFQGWLLPRLRTFSVYREGLDTASLKEAIRILAEARGPLVIFPEGIVTRSNDRLAALIEGTAVIAKSAAKDRAKQNPSGKVVVHPVAIRYRHQGDTEASILPVLAEIESRLTWQPRRGETVNARIARIGEALLGLKEMEYFGTVQSGMIEARLQKLIDRILEPLEEQWKIKRRAKDVPGRVRALRASILPELVDGGLSEDDRNARWRQLADLYLAQQLSLYPSDYLTPGSPKERILETVERFEEDITDESRIHSPLHADVTAGAAIEVSPEKDKSGPGLMERVKDELERLLEIPRTSGPEEPKAEA